MTEKTDGDEWFLVEYRPGDGWYVEVDGAWVAMSAAPQHVNDRYHEQIERPGTAAWRCWRGPAGWKSFVLRMGDGVEAA